MRVAIIGAGAAGLASARHIVKAGLDCEVLELAPNLGGTWLYTDDIGMDRYGFPVYSAMYKGLRTNLPKEVMGFPDFPISKHEKSYLTQAEVLQFLNEYCDNFNLRSRIKFNRFVTNVRPYPTTTTNQWEVTSIHKPTRTTIVDTYDAVMICNGHYNDPKSPQLKGIDLFAGQQRHSHQYRCPKGYEGKRVLVIGAGPSGMDLALQISQVAKSVTLSHHLKVSLEKLYPENVTIKPDVSKVLDSEEVEFVNNTSDKFDIIFYCTGYKYSFPFLDESCGIVIKDNHLTPLYKHMMHIEKPTMCFIGIPYEVCAFQMFDLQARFFVKHLTAAMPRSANDMRADRRRDTEARLARGYSMSQLHLMGPHQEAYYNELSEESNTTPIPSVIVKLRNESVRRLYSDLRNFREDVYEIVDDGTYIKVL